MKTTNNNAYDLIGQLGMALKSQNLKITFDALKVILKEKGISYSDTNNRGISSAVKAAYHRWADIDIVVHHAIADSFTGRDGTHAWAKK